MNDVPLTLSGQGVSELPDLTLPGQPLDPWVIPTLTFSHTADAVIRRDPDIIPVLIILSVLVT